MNILVTQGALVEKLKGVVSARQLDDFITVMDIEDVDLGSDAPMIFVRVDNPPAYREGKVWGIAEKFKSGYKVFSDLRDLEGAFQELVEEHAAYREETPEPFEEVKLNKNAAKIIISTAAKGGTGKTTFAMVLGASLNKKYRVLVVDGDLEDAQLGLIYARADDSYANSEMTYEGVKEFIINRPSDSSTADVLRAPFKPIYYDRIKAPNFTNMLKSIANSGDYDYIIVDTSIRWFTEHEQEVAKVADHIAYVTDLSVGGLLRIRTYIEENPEIRKKMSIILNNYFTEAAITEKNVQSIVEDMNISKIPTAYGLVTFMSMTGRYDEYTKMDEYAEAVDAAAFSIRNALEK